MSTVPEFHPQFVTDSQGRKTAVILPIEEYDELLEDLADLAVTAERKGESVVAHDQAVAELKEDGHLSD